MNRSSGRQIRKDFKCALAESQYKPLADHIIVNKKRAKLLLKQQQQQEQQQQQQHAAIKQHTAGAFERLALTGMQ